MAVLAAAAAAAPLLTGIAAAGTVAQVAGSVVQGRATRKAGEAAQDAANYEAQQLDASAREEVAAGQREGFEIGRQTDILGSRQRAVAAASGAGADDASVTDAMADVQREGSYRRNLALYGAIQRGRGLRAQAEATRRSGRASLQGSRLAAAGTIIGGLGSAASNASSFFMQYGAGRPAGAAGAGGSGVYYGP